MIKFIDKKMGQHGCYEAVVIWNGAMQRGKTFFPASWTREQVINKIHEAYEHFLINGAKAEMQPSGKFRFYGLTKEGIRIEIHMTLGGHIRSAYPIL